MRNIDREIEWNAAKVNEALVMQKKESELFHRGYEAGRVEGRKEGARVYADVIVCELARLRGMRSVTDELFEPADDPAMNRIDELLRILRDVRAVDDGGQ